MKATPADIVGEIKAIIHQDRREQLAAGYRYGSRGISERIAEAYGLSVHTVHSIRDRQRHRNTLTNKKFLVGYTVPLDRLERLREYNKREPSAPYCHRFLKNQR